MVVITIMGILAAVGVPKLTHSIAKAKASELMPAAATYVKLQSAYVIANRNVGTWKKIGYSKRSSDNFRFDKGDEITRKTSIDDLGSEGKKGWEATSLVSLNDCSPGSTWTVLVANGGKDSNGDIHVEFKTNISSTNCAILTQNWNL